MTRSRITVLELAPAADELWVLDRDSRSGYVGHAGGLAMLPDVARGAKLRPRVSAAYASGKATNVARVLDAFLMPGAETPLARDAKARVEGRLVTFLPAQPGGYNRPQVPGEVLAQFTPGGAYLACLQARDIHAVELEFAALPPSEEGQRDRRCANIVARDGGELANFSPYLYWDAETAAAVIDRVSQEPPADCFVLAGSLPLLDERPEPGLYAAVIAGLRSQHPHATITLDVGGAPLRECLERGGESCPDVLCINVDEYCGVPRELWEGYAGLAVVHDKRGCWAIRGRVLSLADLNATPPTARVPPGVRVHHTICAGDASHGGLVLGLALWGLGGDGVRQAAALSQACGIGVVESEGGIRGLTAEGIEGDVRRVMDRSD